MLSKDELKLLGVSPDYRDDSYRRISWDQYFMSLVDLLRKRSHDANTQHGVIAVRDNRIIATGFNGFPEGSQDDILPNIRKDGRKYLFINHAEESMIFYAAKYGIALAGCKVYISGRPCCHCARKLISSGIKEWIVGDIDHLRTEAEDLLYKYWVEAHNVSVKTFASPIKVKEFSGLGC